MSSPSAPLPPVPVVRRFDVAAWGDPAKVLLVSGLLLPFGLMWLARLFVAVGDEVLRRLGRVVHDSLRVVDVAARYGGEELAVLLPHTALDGARVVAQRLLAAARGVPVAGATFLTVSLGAAEWSPGEAADALVARADAALYEAKRGGRDRACTAAPSTAAAARG